MTKEEAIKILRETYDNALFSVRTALKTICPELAESEDERIRRELLEYAKGEVRSYDNMVSGDYDSRDKEDKIMHKWWQKIVAYLEKQQEQKPADLSEMMVHKEPYIAPVPTPMVADERKPAECIDFYDEFYKVYTGPKNILAYVNIFVKKLGYVPIDIHELSACVYYVIKHIEEDTKAKQKEQKPVECELEDAFKYYTDAGITVSCGDIVAKPKEQKPEPVFKVGDKIKLKSEPKYPYREIVDIKNGAYYFDEAVYLPFDNQDNWEKEQKPTKWNTNDKAFIKGCARILDKIGYEASAERLLSMFEQKPAEIDEYEIIKKHITYDSLSSEVNKRLKECGWYVIEESVKWSEEDEKDIAHITRILDDCYDYGKHDLSKTDHENLVNKLKSLRPSWKPSEDEMEALLNTLHPDDPYYCELKSLYEQLKKLM